MAESSFFNKKLPCASCLPCVTTVAHGQTLNFAVCFYFCRVFILRTHGIRACLPCVSPLPCVRKPGTRQTWALPCVGSFAVCCLFGTRQRLCLPCAWTSDTQQTQDTRQILSYAVRTPEEHTANKKYTANVTCLPCAASKTHGKVSAHGKIFSKNLDSAIVTFMGNLIFYVGL